MIALLRVLFVIVPATLWYGARILLEARKDEGADHELLDELPRRWARLLLRAAGVRVVMENVDVIDPDRPQILVANHTSWFDVLALTAYFPGPYRFVAKQELASVPVFGPAWQACGHIAIDRQDRRRAIESLQVAKRRLAEERPTVILFPEGTRSATGELRPFKKGAFVLAIETGVEVVPVGILGSREVMKKGSLAIHPGTIRVRFGTPIPVAGRQISQRDRLTEESRAAVASLLSAPGLNP